MGILRAKRALKQGLTSEENSLLDFLDALGGFVEVLSKHEFKLDALPDVEKVISVFQSFLKADAYKYGSMDSVDEFINNLYTLPIAKVVGISLNPMNTSYLLSRYLELNAETKRIAAQGWEETPEQTEFILKLNKRAKQYAALRKSLEAKLKKLGKAEDSKSSAFRSQIEILKSHEKAIERKLKSIAKEPALNFLLQKRLFSPMLKDNTVGQSFYKTHFFKALLEKALVLYKVLNEENALAFMKLESTHQTIDNVSRVKVYYNEKEKDILLSGNQDKNESEHPENVDETPASASGDEKSFLKKLQEFKTDINQTFSMNKGPIPKAGTEFLKSDAVLPTLLGGVNVLVPVLVVMDVLTTAAFGIKPPLNAEEAKNSHFEEDMNKELKSLNTILGDYGILTVIKNIVKNKALAEFIANQLKEQSQDRELKMFTNMLAVAPAIIKAYEKDYKTFPQELMNSHQSLLAQALSKMIGENVTGEQFTQSISLEKLLYVVPVHMKIAYRIYTENFEPVFKKAQSYEEKLAAFQVLKDALNQDFTQLCKPFVISKEAIGLMLQHMCNAGKENNFSQNDKPNNKKKDDVGDELDTLLSSAESNDALVEQVVEQVVDDKFKESAQHPLFKPWEPRELKKFSLNQIDDMLNSFLKKEIKGKPESMISEEGLVFYQKLMRRANELVDVMSKIGIKKEVIEKKLSVKITCSVEQIINGIIDDVVKETLLSEQASDEYFRSEVKKTVDMLTKHHIKKEKVIGYFVDVVSPIARVRVKSMIRDMGLLITSNLALVKERIESIEAGAVEVVKGLGLPIAVCNPVLIQEVENLLCYSIASYVKKLPANLASEHHAAITQFKEELKLIAEGCKVDAMLIETEFNLKYPKKVSVSSGAIQANSLDHEREMINNRSESESASTDSKDLEIFVAQDLIYKLRLDTNPDMIKVLAEKAFTYLLAHRQYIGSNDQPDLTQSSALIKTFVNQFVAEILPKVINDNNLNAKYLEKNSHYMETFIDANVLTALGLTSDAERRIIPALAQPAITKIMLTVLKEFDSKVKLKSAEFEKKSLTLESKAKSLQEKEALRKEEANVLLEENKLLEKQFEDLMKPACDFRKNVEVLRIDAQHFDNQLAELNQKEKALKNPLVIKESEKNKDKIIEIQANPANDQMELAKLQQDRVKIEKQLSLLKKQKDENTRAAEKIENRAKPIKDKIEQNTRVADELKEKYTKHQNDSILLKNESEVLKRVSLELANNTNTYVKQNVIEAVSLYILNSLCNQVYLYFQDPTLNFLSLVEACELQLKVDLNDIIKDDGELSTLIKSQRQLAFNHLIRLLNQSLTSDMTQDQLDKHKVNLNALARAWSYQDKLESISALALPEPVVNEKSAMTVPTFSFLEPEVDTKTYDISDKYLAMQKAVKEASNALVQFKTECDNYDLNAPLPLIETAQKALSDKLKSYQHGVLEFESKAQEQKLNYQNKVIEEQALQAKRKTLKSQLQSLNLKLEENERVISEANKADQQSRSQYQERSAAIEQKQKSAISWSYPKIFVGVILSFVAACILIGIPLLWWLHRDAVKAAVPTVNPWYHMFERMGTLGLRRQHTFLVATQALNSHLAQPTIASNLTEIKASLEANRVLIDDTEEEMRICQESIESLAETLKILSDKQAEVSQQLEEYQALDKDAQGVLRDMDAADTAKTTMVTSLSAMAKNTQASVAKEPPTAKTVLMSRGSLGGSRTASSINNNSWLSRLKSKIW